MGQKDVEKMKYPSVHGGSGHAFSHHNVTEFPSERVDYRPRVLTECRVYRFDRPIYAQPQISGPYAYAWMNPVMTFACLFALAWMVGR
jgi:hypothetical protein